MATPVLILLALTKGALERFGAGTTSRTVTGITRVQVQAVADALRKHGFSVCEIDAVPLGSTGWNAGRRQHHTRALLKMARERADKLSDWHVKVLLITDADIYDSDTAFVAGQAEVNGRAAVMSISRLGAADEARFLRRVLKEAVHELGHTLGLGHCRENDCVMYSSRTLADSDIKDHELCKRCRTKAGRALAPDHQTIMSQRP
jgi:archaemetzincin